METHLLVELAIGTAAMRQHPNATTELAKRRHSGLRGLNHPRDRADHARKLRQLDLQLCAACGHEPVISCSAISNPCISAPRASVLRMSRWSVSCGMTSRGMAGWILIDIDDLCQSGARGSESLRCALLQVL